jgi:hypothetical protein
MKVNTGVVLKDVGGRSLHKPHVEALELYIEQSLKAIKEARVAGGLRSGKAGVRKDDPKSIQDGVQEVGPGDERLCQ